MQLSCHDLKKYFLKRDMAEDLLQIEIARRRGFKMNRNNSQELCDDDLKVVKELGQK